MIPGCSRRESVVGVAPTLHHLDPSRGGGRGDTSLSHAPSPRVCPTFCCPLPARCAIPTVSPAKNSLVYFISIAYIDRPVLRGHCQEAKRGEAGRHRITRNCEALGAFLLTRATTELSLSAMWCLIGATPRGQPWTSAVTLPQGAQRAERAADGDVVYISRVLSVSPRASRINAQRGTQFDPYNTRNCLPPNKLRREIQ